MFVFAVKTKCFLYQNKQMNIELKEVKTRADLKKFVKFPFTLYKGVEYWVPPLTKTEMDTFDSRRNPAFKHSDVILLLAYKGDEIVGRIAGIINRKELSFINQNHARFSWGEFIDDPAVSTALFHRVETWAKDKGMTILKGPYGFTDLDLAGYLIKGFEEVGTIFSPYNFPYYQKHLEALGFEKDVEWLEYALDVPEALDDRFKRTLDLVQKRYGIRPLELKSRADLVLHSDGVFDLIIDTYKELHAYVPFSKEQIKSYVDQYINRLPPEFVCIVVDENGQKVGFGVTAPSLLKAFKKANGSMFPFGVLRIYRALKKNDTVELYLIGTKSEWRNKGVTAVIFSHFFNTFHKFGIKKVKANPMLIHNAKVLALWKDYNPEEKRRRRSFIKVLKESENSLPKI